MSKGKWSILAPEVFRPIVGSGLTYEIPLSDWPTWAQEAGQFRRVFVYMLQSGEETPSVATTSQVVARLLTERYDVKDSKPMNYNFYSVVERTDGVFLQSGPSRQVDFGHHLSLPVSALNLGVSSRDGTS